MQFCSAMPQSGSGAGLLRMPQSTVELHGQTAAATADRIGEWTVWLNPEHAGGPYTLTIKGDGAEGTRTVSDILLGDVWVASGQSNMEMPLKGFGPETPVAHGAEEIAAATHPEIRLLREDHKASDYPLDDITASWTTCRPETAAGLLRDRVLLCPRNLRQRTCRRRCDRCILGVAHRQTPGSLWIPWAVIRRCCRRLQVVRSLQRIWRRRMQFVPPTLVRTWRQRRLEDRQPAILGSPDSEAWMPAAIFNGMIAPLTPYTIKGVVWYQGETNSQPGGSIRVLRAAIQSAHRGLASTLRGRHVPVLICADLVVRLSGRGLADHSRRTTASTRASRDSHGSDH